jgi:hypothetical protein
VDHTTTHDPGYPGLIPRHPALMIGLPWLPGPYPSYPASILQQEVLDFLYALFTIEIDRLAMN